MIITNMPFAQDQIFISLVCSFQILSRSGVRILVISSFKDPLPYIGLPQKDKQSSKPPLLLYELKFLKGSSGSSASYIFRKLGAGGQPST